MDAASVVMKRGAKTPDRRNETTGTYVTYAGGGSKKTCERQTHHHHLFVYLNIGGKGRKPLTCR